MRPQRILPIFAALSIAACGPAKEREPNDSPEQAQAVRAGPVTGTLSSAADADVFSLQVPEGKVLSVKLGGIRSVDFALSVQRGGVALKDYDETSTGGDEQVLDVGGAAEATLIRVSNKNPKAEPAQPYRLELALSPAEGNESEPNDTALSANPLAPGGTIRGHYYPSQNLLAQARAREEAAAAAQAALQPGATEQSQAAVAVEGSSPTVSAPVEVSSPVAAAPPPPPAASIASDGGEEDWFKVHVDAAGMRVLNVDVAEVAKIDAILEVYDANFYRLKEVDAAGPGEPESLRNFGVRGPVDYYLRLRSKSRLASNAEAPYQLLTELIPYQGGTEFEPNDQRAEATPFDGPSITGALASAGDQDWYKVSVAGEERMILSAQATALAGLDLVLSLRDDLGNVLVIADNAGKEQPEAITGFGLGKGEYHLVVAEKAGRKAGAQTQYTLSKALSAAQPGLEFELNDSSAAAQAVKVGDSVDGYISPKADVDFYEFNAYQKGRVGVDLTGLLTVQWTMALLDQEGRELKSLAAKKPGEKLALAEDLEPGTYFLKISAAAPSQVNVRDKYTLRLRAL